MSLATIAATLLKEAGVSADDILREAGVDREGAVRQLADRLGVNLADLAPTPDLSSRDDVRQITDEEVAAVRRGLAVLNRAFQ